VVDSASKEGRAKMAWLEQLVTKAPPPRTWLDEVQERQSFRDKDRWELEEELRHLGRVSRSLRLQVAEKDEELAKAADREGTKDREIASLHAKVTALKGVRELTEQAQRELATLRERLATALDQTAAMRGTLDETRDDLQRARDEATAEKVLVTKLASQLATTETGAREAAAAARAAAEARAKEQRDAKALTRKYRVAARDLEDTTDRARKLQEQVERFAKLEVALREALCDRDDDIAKLRADLAKAQTSARTVRLEAARAADLERDVKRLVALLATTADYANFAALWGRCPGGGQSYVGGAADLDRAEAAFLFGFDDKDKDEDDDSEDSEQRPKTPKGIVVVETPQKRKEGTVVAPSRSRRSPNEDEWSHYAAAVAARYGPTEEAVGPAAEEGDKWVPRRVAAAARHLVEAYGVPPDQVRKFVQTANRAWFLREKRRLKRLHTKVDTLKRKSQHELTYDKVVADNEIKRLKALLKRQRLDVDFFFGQAKKKATPKLSQQGPTNKTTRPKQPPDSSPRITFDDDDDDDDAETAPIPASTKPRPSTSTKKNRLKLKPRTIVAPRGAAS